MKAKAATAVVKFEWKCPKCGARANKHGKGKCAFGGDLDCPGFLCECSDEGEDKRHGETLQKQCEVANCYHCGWGGVFPQAPKSLASWEKKALEAGWQMPTARKKELGL